MEDKVKEFRDKNPILDFLAGFIPGVGEAQDAHDFIHAVKDKDYMSMGLAAIGLALPGLTGSQLKRIIKGRKYAKASKPAIYDSATAPKQIKVGKRDITEMHLNDGVGSEQIFGKQLISELGERFAQADHGTAIRIGESLSEPNYGLSQSSVPIFLKMARRWAGQGKGGFFVPEGEPSLVKMNSVAEYIAPPGKQPLPKPDQKFVDKINEEVKEINMLGYNFPMARFVPRQNKFKPGTAAYEAFEKSPNKQQLFIPNIGFLKFQNGGKYTYRRRSQKSSR